MKDEELKSLMEMLDGARRSDEPTAHVTVEFLHTVSDNPIPWVYDYAESIGLKVVNLFSQIYPSGKVHREFLLRRSGKVWDGSI